MALLSSSKIPLTLLSDDAIDPPPSFPASVNPAFVKTGACKSASRKMVNRRSLFVLPTFLLFLGGSLSAQSATTVADLSLRETLKQLIGPTGSPAAAEAIALATGLEVSTGPLGTTSGGFVFKLDPTTGLLARTATTFGPSFSERALTTGEGKISAAVTLKPASYGRLGNLPLDTMKLAVSNATIDEFARSGWASLVLSSSALVLSGTVGVTDMG
jgi:hypothetical protein